MAPVRFLTDATQFHNGVWAGLAAAVLVIVAAFALRRERLPVAGWAFAVACCVALSRSGPVADHRSFPPAVWAGMAIAGVCAELAWYVRPEPLLVALAAIPGAVVSAGSVVGADTMARILVVAFAAVGGALAADFDAHDPLGAGPAMWLLTVAGVYFTVPDTEAARAVIGVALPLIVLGFPLRTARLGVGGAVSAACVLGWVVGQGGHARPGAVVGGVAAIGVFALAPIVRRATHDRVAYGYGDAYLVGYILVAHLACVAAASRWAGLAESRSTAMWRVLAFLPVGVALTFGIATVSAVLADRARAARPHPPGGRPTPMQKR